MSMHPKGRLPKQKKQVQVDLKQADTIKCSDCNNYLFITAGMLAGTGLEEETKSDSFPRLDV